MTWFFARTMGNVYSGRVLHFFGEALRQAGLLITGSVLIVLALVGILGLQCGIEGAYGAQAVGAKSAAGAFTALCNLREVTPYAFGYMMAAKVGTGMVAEIGAMRISDEIDALEVIGVPSVPYLCSTRLLGVWMVLPFVFVAAVAVGFLASALAVVVQVDQVSVGGYFQIFWQFQNPVDLLYSGIKTMAMATFVVLVGVYYGYHAAGGSVGVGTATAKSMVVNILGIHVIGLLGTQIFWGARRREPELVGDRGGQVVGAERRRERGLVGDHEAVAGVLRGREARGASRRAAHARPGRRTTARARRRAPALAATSGLATTGRRAVVERLAGRSAACCEVSIT